MNIDWLSAAALAVVILLYAGLILLRKRNTDFTITILLGLVLGVVTGILFSGHTDWITPLGKIYVATLSAIVAPLIIVSLLGSILSLGSAAQLKGIGLGLIFEVGKGANLVIDGVNADVFQGKVTPFSEVLIGSFLEM